MLDAFDNIVIHYKVMDIWDFNIFITCEENENYLVQSNMLIIQYWNHRKGVQKRSVDSYGYLLYGPSLFHFWSPKYAVSAFKGIFHLGVKSLGEIAWIIYR